MSSILKEKPTQKEYDRNPEYFMDFERRLEEERRQIMKIVNEAGDNNDIPKLESQILSIGMIQAKLKEALLIRWGSEYPLWQKIEALDMIIMYHDVIVETHKIIEKRKRGQ